MKYSKRDIIIVSVVAIAVIIMVIFMFKPEKPSYVGQWNYKSNLNMEAGVMVDFTYINIEEEGECVVKYNTTGRIVYGTWTDDGSYLTLTLTNGTSIRVKLREDGDLLVNRQYIFAK